MNKTWTGEVEKSVRFIVRDKMVPIKSKLVIRERVSERENLKKKMSVIEM